MDGVESFDNRSLEHPPGRQPTRAGLVFDARWIVTLVTIIVLGIGTATFFFGRWTERNETAPAAPPPSDLVREAPGPDNTIVTMPPPTPAGVPSPVRPDDEN